MRIDFIQRVHIGSQVLEAGDEIRLVIEYDSIRGSQFPPENEARRVRRQASFFGVASSSKSSI